LATWRSWGIALGAAAAVRGLVALVVLGGMPLVSDARDYFDVAARLASGAPSGAFYWPPGEALVLAGSALVFGKGLLVARLLTVAMSVAAVALATLLARELGGVDAARACAATAAFYAPSVLLCGQTYAQHLAALCLAAVAYFGMRALRERRAVLFAITGAALGVGCLTRPSMGSVAPVLAFAWVLSFRAQPLARRRLLAGAALTTAIAMGCVVPAQLHDQLAGAGWTVSTNNERNFFLGNNPYTPDYKTSHLGQRALDEIEPEARAYLESFYALPDARAAMRRAAIGFMLRHPFRTAWRTALRAADFWGFDYLATREIQNWRGWTAARALPLLALEAGSYLAIALLALAAILTLRAACEPSWRGWLIALVVAYEAPYAIAFSGGTYHFPVMPLVLPFAAVAASAGLDVVWRRARTTLPAMIGYCIFALVQLQYAYVALAMS
jgi:4-amino-4-deoxy-L-arabinose transferase-like glycosyltransferase